MQGVFLIVVAILSRLYLIFKYIVLILIDDIFMSLINLGKYKCVNSKLVMLYLFNQMGAI